MSKDITQLLWNKRLVFIVILGLSFYFVPNLANAAELSTLGASTYLGGTSIKNDYDSVKSVAVDTTGNVYVIGETSNSNFPITSTTYDSTGAVNGDIDVFVAKFSPDLSTLLASTFLGGSAGDNAVSVMVNSSGNVIVSGNTYSTDFPVSLSAYDKTYNGNGDFFVSTFSSDLKQLLSSTYVGGSGVDSLVQAVVNSTGEVYLTGNVYSTDYPVSAVAYDKTHNGQSDIVITKLSSNLSLIIASSYIGGNDMDTAPAIVINPNNSSEVYLSGTTGSQNFPMVGATYNKIIMGQSDIFIAKLNSDFSSMLLSTFLGGKEHDGNKHLLVTADSVVVVGDTFSIDYPTTAGAYDMTYNGQSDIVVSKLPLNLSSLTLSTLVGGSNMDNPRFAGIDAAGRIYVVGSTYSQDYPVIAGSYDTSYGSPTDVVISLIDNNYANLVASTYFGGFNADSVWAGALTNSKLYFVGETNSYGYFEFPVTNGAYDTTNNGMNDGFVAFISLGGTPAPAPKPIMYINPELSQGENLSFVVPGTLPDTFKSIFRNSKNVDTELKPSLVNKQPDKNLLVYSTQTLIPDTYKVLIQQNDGTLIAEGESIVIKPTSITYQLVTDKKSFKLGESIPVKIYPGLYAYNSMMNGEYELRWFDYNKLPVAPIVIGGPNPTDGFSIYLTYTYSTRGFKPGRYNVQLFDKVNNKILATSVISIY